MRAPQWVRLTALVLFGLAAGKSGAQEVSTGALAGPWTEGKASSAVYAQVDWPPLSAGAAEITVPPGTGVLGGTPVSTQLTWAGWEVHGTGWSNKVLFGALSPATFQTEWAGTEVDLAMGLGYGAVETLRVGPWVFGAGGAAFGAEVQGEGFTHIGTVKGDTGFVFAGSPFGGIFYGEVDLASQAKISLLGYEPLSAEGSLKGRVAGVGMVPRWRTGNWELSLGAAGGFLWVEGGNFTVVTTVPSFSFNTLSVTMNSTTNTYAFTAAPAWFLVFHPQITWNFCSQGALTLGRWVPLSGNWTLTGPGSQSDMPSGPVPDTLAGGRNELVNLLLAGLDLKINWNC